MVWFGLVNNEIHLIRRKHKENLEYQWSEVLQPVVKKNRSGDSTGCKPIASANRSMVRVRWTKGRTLNHFQQCGRGYDCLKIGIK